MKKINIRRKDKTHNPAPAIAAGGGDFSVQEAPGNFGQSRMPGWYGEKRGLFISPMDDSKEALAVRAHEYGHLIVERDGYMGKEPITYMQNLGVKDIWYQSVVDVFVNSFMLKKGVEHIHDLSINITGHEKAKDEVKASTALRAFGLKMWEMTLDKLIPSCTHRDYISTAQQRIRRIAEECVEGRRENVIEKLSDIALTLQNYFEEPPPPPEIKDEEGNEMPSEIKEAMEHEKHANKQIRKFGFANKVYTYAGEMIISKSPMVDNYTTRLKGKKRIAGFVGGMRNPLRAMLPMGDGRCFSYTVKRESGTLLIDCSGSLDLSIGEIYKFIEILPAATVALYSGRECRTKGDLIIVAEKGRLADIQRTKASMHVLNIIDLPALEWLSKQKEPRIWVSDGKVTGYKETMSAVYTTKCFQTAERGNIMRVGTVSEATKIAQIITGRHN